MCRGEAVRRRTRVSHGRLVQAPCRPDEIVGRSVAADALDDAIRRQNFQEVDQRANVFVPLHQRHLAARDPLGQGSIFHGIQIVNLYRVEPQPSHFPSRGQHVVVRLAGQTENHMGADLESAASAASHRVEKCVVMVAAIHPVQRAVVDRLHAIFDREIRSPAISLKQIEHVVRHAIGPGADRQSDDLRMCERRFVQRTQSSTGA